MMNLTILWPGENEFLFVDSLKAGTIIDARIDEKGKLLFWMDNWSEENRSVLTAWRVSREQANWVANFTILESFQFCGVQNQDEIYWILTYSDFGIALNRIVLDPANGNSTITQIFKQDLVISTHEFQLGVYRTTPFITYMAGSPELGNPNPLPFMGYWTATGNFISEVLETEHHIETGVAFYDPVADERGLIIPYFIENITGYSEHRKKDGKAPYVPREIYDNDLDPNQDIDGVYLVTNISGLTRLKPALFNLKEAQSPLLPAFWPWVVGLTLVALGGVCISYWRFRHRKKAEKLIESLGESLDES
jgi:hypothetical protein